MTSFGIIGMGKMGHAIAASLEADQKASYHTFNRISPENQHLLKQCEVVIEFTTSEASPGIIEHCIMSGIPIVSGTTGWQEYHLERIKKVCHSNNGKFLYASNFSIGMNITFALNRKLAAIIDAFPQFKASILEKHHIHKKDAPSGTAFSLIEDITENNSHYDGFEMNQPESDPKKIKVTAIREGEIKGYHEVAWNSGLEQIKICHEAFDRKIFAEGAILAASWLKNKKPGIYTMRDIIGL
jgi:4-hydroxy-tetrahydrodipicolinate reductase